MHFRNYCNWQMENAQIYINEWTKEMNSDKKHSEDGVSGDEYTTSGRKFKNPIKKRDLNKKLLGLWMSKNSRSIL
jgi:hypothetical protein